MDAPQSTDPIDPLPRATYLQVMHALRALLPPPPTNSPEDAACRDQATLAHVAFLQPANPEEANLAAQYAAACGKALDCVRLASANPADAMHVLKCTAQSTSMMRQAHRWRTALLRAQADRRKPDAAAAARTQDAPTAQPADAPIASAPQPANSPQPDPVAAAERYALLHRKRAALIRRLGCVPHKLNLGPIRPGVVRAIVTGTTPILRTLDDKPHRTAALAA